MPSWAKVRATAAVRAATTLVAVKKIRMARGMTMMAIVRNWRRQERLGPLLDGLGDLLHLGRALVEGRSTLRASSRPATMPTMPATRQM